MYSLMKLCCVVFCMIFSLSASAESQSWKFPENNNNVIKMQKKGGSHKKSGDVEIEYYGHMAFKITSPNGLTMMLDPWRNDPTGAFGVWYPEKFPEVAVDITISSHAHFDHDAIYRTHASMNLERLAGEFVLGDVKITGLADKHQCHAPGEIKWDIMLKENFGLDNLCPDENPMSWDNVIYIIETGGLRIGFWGDNRPNPSKNVAAELADLDVLIMNIDGSEHILSYEQIDTLISRYKPKAVIPGHYLTKGAVLPVSSLKTADQWVAQQKSVVNLEKSSLVVNPKVLRSAKQRVYYFGANYSKK